MMLGLPPQVPPWLAAQPQGAPQAAPPMPPGAAPLGAPPPQAPSQSPPAPAAPPPTTPLSPMGNLQGRAQATIPQEARARDAGNIQADANDAVTAAMAQGVIGERDLQDLRVHRMRANLAKVDQYDELQKRALAQADGTKLEDPSKHYWAQQSTGGKIMSGIALLLGGFGAAVQGAALKRPIDNPAMALLQRSIDQDYDAQKANVENAWKKVTEAGHLADTAQNRAEFEDTFYQRYNDASWGAIQHQVATIGQASQSPLMRMKAQDAADAIAQSRNDIRTQEYVTAQQQMLARIQQSQQRQREARDFFQKALEKHADLSPEDARAQAVKDTTAAGFDPSALGPIYSGAETVRGQEASEPKRADTTADGIPLVDPNTGKRLKPEEVDRYRARQVTFADGSRAFAPTDKQAEEANLRINASEKLRGVVAGIGELQKKLQDGTLTRDDIGRWNSLRTEGITLYNTANLGSARATGHGEAELLGQDAFPEPPSSTTHALTSTPSLPAASVERRLPFVSSNAGKLDALKKSIAENDRDIRRMVGSGGEAPKPAAAAPPQDYSKFGFKPAGK